MATQNLNTYDRCRCIDYIGTPEALINAGLIQPDWVDGLEERHNRFIIGTGDRIEIVDRIGKGNFINHDLRAVGLIVLKKLRDGTLRAAKYRTALEERAIDEARTAQYRAAEAARQDAKTAQQVWIRSKETRTDESLSRWKKAILREAKEVFELIQGDRGFTNPPKIKFSRYDTSRVNQAIDMLVAAINDGTPVFYDIEAKNNVYSLSDRSYK